MFFLKLFILALRRLNSSDDYFKFQLFQARRVIFDLKKFIPGKLNEMSILDLGCGHGAYSISLADYFNEVYAVDRYVDLSLAFKRYKKPNIKIYKKNILGYKAKVVDIIFCASVIEHIPSDKLEFFLSTIHSNLKKGGFLYLSFPPFKSPIGGHLSAPFHYLPDKIAFLLTYIFKRKKIYSYSSMFGKWGLYKLNIEEIESILSKKGFGVISIRSRFMPSFYNYFFSRNNYFNWHCEFIAIKN